MLFALDVSERDGWAVVGVTGELELATAPRLRQQILALVGAGSVNVVLDLSQVDFMDSVGLGVVVGALHRTRGRGGELRVVVTQSRVRALFTITRLDAVIDIADSLDAVLDAPAPVRDGAGSRDG